MKKYAYYLPQFHEIPENNKWWGKGFTEWVNVKKAVSLYKNHHQPKVPLHKNYYTLDQQTLIEQAELANSYQLDGMIFYHYYFCGKKLLEKPAEILLRKKDIPMRFFFCWANHSWIRSWQGSKTILMDQTYGDKDDWKRHFEYLLPFFKDERYEKKDNKPLFMIFDSVFDEKEPMFKLWNTMAIENGFDGMYFVERLENYANDTLVNSNQLERHFYYREPNASLNAYIHNKYNLLVRIKYKLIRMLSTNGFKCVEVYDGNKLYDEMISKIKDNCHTIPGLFFEWDNTPRHGYRGYVITPPSKDKFMKYMDTIKDSEFVFINAWNEWCEGMMLEPTEENGYKYLEWIKEWSEKNENRFNGF